MAMVVVGCSRSRCTCVLAPSLKRDFLLGVCPYDREGRGVKPRPSRGCGVLDLLSLLVELELRRVRYGVASGVLFAQVEVQRLAGAGVALGGGPVELVVAATQVLQSGSASRDFLHQIVSCPDAA